jgi:hypothetical protein
MNCRAILPLTALLIAFSAHGAFAQQAADIDGVKAASKAFYDAVVVVDDGTAMEKVWAQTPYVTYVGPRSTAIIVGWEAQRKYWIKFNKPFAQRTVALVDAHVHVVGKSRLGNRYRKRAGANERRHHPESRLDGDQRLREDRWPLADGFPSCAAKAAVSATAL